MNKQNYALNNLQFLLSKPKSLLVSSIFIEY